MVICRPPRGESRGSSFSRASTSGSHKVRYSCLLPASLVGWGGAAHLQFRPGGPPNPVGGPGHIVVTETRQNPGQQWKCLHLLKASLLPILWSKEEKEHVLSESPGTALLP